MDKWFLFIIPIVCLFINKSDVLASGGDTTGTTLSPDINTTSTPNTAPNLNTNLNTNTINPGISAFSSSFSGYSSAGSQCGFSISSGYINNGNANDGFQIMSTFNSNPCTNQRELENIRQQNENKREVIRANATIINTCINARATATKNGINADTICKLNDFQMPRSP